MINISPTPQITKIYLVTNCYGDPNKIYIGKENSNKKHSRESDHKRKFGKNIIFSFIDEINSQNHKDWKPLECFWIEHFRQWGFEIMNRNKGEEGIYYDEDFESDEGSNTRIDPKYLKRI